MGYPGLHRAAETGDPTGPAPESRPPGMASGWYARVVTGGLNRLLKSTAVLRDPCFEAVQRQDGSHHQLARRVHDGRAAARDPANVDLHRLQFALVEQ